MAISSLNEMVRAIVLSSEQCFLLSGTENIDGGLIINLNKMQKTPGHGKLFRQRKNGCNKKIA
jgi:hypothetical protein